MLIVFFSNRSYQEIEIANVPVQFSPILGSSTSRNESKPSLIEVTYLGGSSIVSAKTDNATTDVQNILYEILRSDQFQFNSNNYHDQSDHFGEHTNSDQINEFEDQLDCNDNNTTESLNTDNLSLNIFEGISLEDSSINNYVNRLRSKKHNDNYNEAIVSDRHSSKNTSTSRDNTNLDVCNEYLSEDRIDSTSVKVKTPEVFLTQKSSVTAASSTELDNFKELSGNQSINSPNTSTTDYKQCYDECQSRVSCNCHCYEIE